VTSPLRTVLDDRQLRVVYQPVVDLRTRKTFAYEALVRSQSPAFKSPLELFAAAVAENCTGELGRVIRQMSIAGCPDTPLFLNVHPAELNERWIVQPDDPVFQHGADVYLEITESVPLSHFQLCKSILHEVRDRGIYLVVDDLGAGYSNLKYIADLQPRVVKLDRELIAGIVRDSRLFKLVSGMVVLCKELEALVVAEGIETPIELDAVLESGARFGQGYVLARPAFPPPPVTWPEMPSRRRTAKFSRPPANRSVGTGLRRSTRPTRNPPRGRS
jgi:EAL domain-containing protein (putative c-di-GMP-specific phosphodiesterase class I)